jgi:hypothetical protein
MECTQKVEIMGSSEHMRRPLRNREHWLLGDEIQLLDQVEEAFLTLVNAREKQQGLRFSAPTHLETLRGHGDELDIVFMWRQRDGVLRNIHAFIKEHAKYAELAIDVNAWRDEVKGRGESGRRNWQHAEVGHLKITPRQPLDVASLQQTLGRAYSTVSKWGRSDLIRQSPLLPA